MGMFDYIICKSELIPIDFRGRLFQTKAFECNLFTYEITKDGDLLRYTCDLDGYTTELSERIDYHGIFDIHGATVSPPGEPRVYYRFNVKFTDGKLVSIEKGN